VNSILVLAIEYFKIGCIAIGGGYTVVPFLYYFVEKYHWYTANDITQMIAISNLTPGPIGINMATFVGMKVGGIIGATFTTISFMLPSFFILCIVARFLKCNKDNPYICNIMSGLRPAALALLTVACIKILNATVLSIDKYKESMSFFDLVSLKAIVFFIFFILVGFVLKKQPMWLILIAVVCGFFVALLFR